ncbi:hypothetical protein RRG08_065181 [Elysia crispata]|uniref:Uncharacterized protein n=1 Tax=Elysia crispata TaxID=231223 RepID=A0AAE1D8A4_9GAST|nr:hypothetical protein RRG08_065181 [Elysia crispata]
MDMGGQAVPRGYYSNGSAVGSKEMLEASLEGFKPSGEDSNITRHGRLPPHQKNFAFIGKTNNAHTEDNGVVLEIC